MIARIRTFPLNGLFLLTIASWSLAVIASLLWNQKQHENEVNVILHQIGMTAIAKDKLYFQWNSNQNGVYVRVNNTTKPNHLLTPEMTRDRDLTVSPNLSLTLLDPAHMTRQVYELAKEKKVISGKVTSLTPINPTNEADMWEKMALQAVKQGTSAYYARTAMAGQEYFRILLPLRAEENCLKCHARQRDNKEEVLGGISVALPVADFHDHASTGDRAILIGHAAIWTLGLTGILLGYVALARAETAREQAEDEILTLAQFDKLTGLVNRNLFKDRANQALTLANRQKSKVGFLYIDLDRFKPINDSYGHEAGDSILQEVGKRLMASVRESDTVARVGGDEFVVILQNIQDMQQAASLAEKIISSLKHPFMVKGDTHSIGASIGISCFPDDGMDMDALLKKADAAMYQVKRQAGGNFRFAQQ